MAQEPPDELLMARVSRGDREAFRALVERHQQSVFQLAWRQLGSRAEAEEVAQDTFERLYHAAGGYREIGCFRAWLLVIATRLCLNRKARHARWREQATEPDILAALAGPAPGAAEEELDQVRLHRAVRDAVLALPEEQRMAVLLCRFEGLSYAEIGAAMGKSVPAVTSLIWRAGERLRLALGEQLPPDGPASRKEPAPGRLKYPGADEP